MGGYALMKEVTYVFKIRDVYTGNWLPIKILVSESGEPPPDRIITLVDSEGMIYMPEEVVH